MHCINSQSLHLNLKRTDIYGIGLTDLIVSVNMRKHGNFTCGCLQLHNHKNNVLCVVRLRTYETGISSSRDSSDSFYNSNNNKIVADSKSNVMRRMSCKLSVVRAGRGMSGTLSESIHTGTGA